jgi:hypothetical protein
MGGGRRWKERFKDSKILLSVRIQKAVKYVAPTLIMRKGCMCNYPLVSTVISSRTPWISKSWAIKWCILYRTYAHPSTHFQSSLDYL